MFIYSVTVNIDPTVQEEWLNWMKTIHIPQVMATGFFTENRILKVLAAEEGNTYSFQYTFKTVDDFENYQQHHAPALQKDHAERYKDKFVAFRTLLQVV